MSRVFQSHSIGSLVEETKVGQVRWCVCSLFGGVEVCCRYLSDNSQWCLRKKLEGSFERDVLSEMAV